VGGSGSKLPNPQAFGGDIAAKPRGEERGVTIGRQEKERSQEGTPREKTGGASNTLREAACEHHIKTVREAMRKRERCKKKGKGANKRKNKKEFLK